jgi:hypothetical protein
MKKYKINEHNKNKRFFVIDIPPKGELNSYELSNIHEVQLVNYLKATGIEVGLLINFGTSVQVKRRVMDKQN